MENGGERPVKNAALAGELKQFSQMLLGEFPFEIVFKDWTGQSYSRGLCRPHWKNCPLFLEFKTEAAAKDFIALNGLRFLERFLQGQVILSGNLYLIQDVKTHTGAKLGLGQLFWRLIRNKALQFQNVSQAKQNVKSHYDIPQDALNVYLDQVYRSYSCGMFENPDQLDLKDFARVGQGKGDDFDSLEKAQWNKFRDAIQYVNPGDRETVLDIGCGYGGQLDVALEHFPRCKITGWTPSENQIREGRRFLSRHDPSGWEMNEGDYREEKRVFDHVTSTGMISHVGPRGLVPYVRNVRNLIRKGGRYVHHSLMTAHIEYALDREVGIAFNKKYVWPGFHWFTLGDHIKALEQNGFEIERITNLSAHYAKTTAAWYERMMGNETVMLKNLGQQTLRAWQIYLAGSSAGFKTHSMHVYRVYCVAL
jgi:cyclopropane fatty-acyl-phospholipid synthase-like methyltransferase